MMTNIGDNFDLIDRLAGTLNGSRALNTDWPGKLSSDLQGPILWQRVITSSSAASGIGESDSTRRYRLRTKLHWAQQIRRPQQ
jgi:hypothetical protein